MSQGEPIYVSTRPYLCLNVSLPMSQRQPIFVSIGPYLCLNASLPTFMPQFEPKVMCLERVFVLFLYILLFA